MVMVLVVDVPAITPASTRSIYGPVPATTSTTTGPEIPPQMVASKNSWKELKLVPDVGLN